jgi:biotin operon repressor
MFYKFGVEIELIGLDSYQAVEVLRNIDVPFTTDVSYRKSGYDNWKAMSDSSIVGNGRSTCEVVSRILEGEDGIEELKKVCRALSSAGATVNSTCGLHVHVDASSMTGDNIRHIITRYAHHESTIDAFMPRSRRSNSNAHCQSLVSQIQMFDQHGIGNRNYWFSNDPILVTNALSGFRYIKINTQAYTRSKTIEFRHHSGSVNASKIETWVRFLQQFIKNSVETTPVTQDFIEVTETRATQEPTAHYATSPWVNNPNRDWSYTINYKHHIIMDLLFARNYEYVSVRELAQEARISETSIPAYISTIRNAYHVTIKNNRTYGYKLTWSTTSQHSVQQPVVTTYTQHIPVHNRITDSLWDGVDEIIQNYYAERTSELA